MRLTLSFCLALSLVGCGKYENEPVIPATRQHMDFNYGFNPTKMVWLPSSSNGIAMCQSSGDRPQIGKDSKMNDTMIGVDLAKNVFQVHGASMSGEVKFRKKLTRGQFERFMSEQPSALVIMEACGGAHHWAREMQSLGHEVKLSYARKLVTA